MQEMQVQPLIWEDPVEEEVATHSSILLALLETIKDHWAWNLSCKTITIGRPSLFQFK